MPIVTCCLTGLYVSWCISAAGPWCVRVIRLLCVSYGCCLDRTPDPEIRYRQSVLLLGLIHRETLSTAFWHFAPLLLL